MGIIYKLLSNKLKKQNKVLLFIIIVQTVSTVISAAIPYLSGNFVDVLILGTTVKSILEYALIIASIGIFSCAFSYVYTLKKVRVKNNISFELNKEIIQHLHKIPLEHRYEPIYMSQRINSDSTIIVSFFFDRVLTVCINTVQLVFLLSIFWILNKSIFFLVLLFCFIYIAIYQVLKRPLYNSNLMYKEEQSVFFNKLSEQLYLLEEIKVHWSDSI